MSVFTGGPYGRLAVMLNTLSSLNIEIIIIIIITAVALTDLIWLKFSSSGSNLRPRGPEVIKEHEI